MNDVPLAEVWRRLGGGEVRHGRGRAFWRHSADWNVSIDLDRNRWMHFPTQAGGGPLQLVEVALPADRRGALEWLQAEGLIERRRPLTFEERRRYAKARANAEAMAKVAAAWLSERLGELDELKRVAAESGDMGCLAEAANEHYRLSAADACGVIQAWQRARMVEPHGTRQLERMGLRWRQACEAMTRVVVNSLATGNSQLKGGTRDVA